MKRAAQRSLLYSAYLEWNYGYGIVLIVVLFSFGVFVVLMIIIFLKISELLFRDLIVLRKRVCDNIKRKLPIQKPKMLLKLNVISTGLLVLSQGSQALFSVYDDYFSSPKYVIKYDNQDFYTHHESSQILQGSLNNSESYHLVKSKDSSYLCRIPEVPPVEKLQPTLNDDYRPQKIVDAFQKVKQALTDKCVFQFAGYWSYAFCFDRELSQFNGQIQDFVDKKVSKFILGKFNKDEAADRYTLNKEGGLWYLGYNLEGGTLCDLTGRPRSAEIQFVCDPSLNEPSLKWVKEYKSCQYQAQVAVPDLCADDLFGGNKEEKVHEIDCKKIVNTDIHVVDKEDYIKHSFYNHPLKISLSEYRLEPLGNGIFLGRPKIPGGLDVIIYNSDKEDDTFLGTIAKSFFTGLARKKIYNGEEVLSSQGEFTYYTYVYGRRGDYLNTLEIVKNSDGKAILYDRNDLSHLEKNVMSVRIPPQDENKVVSEERIETEEEKVKDSNAEKQQQQQQQQPLMQAETTDYKTQELKTSEDQHQPVEEEQNVMQHDEL